MPGCWRSLVFHAQSEAQIESGEPLSSDPLNILCPKLARQRHRLVADPRKHLGASGSTLNHGWGRLGGRSGCGRRLTQTAVSRYFCVVLLLLPDRWLLLLFYIYKFCERRKVRAESVHRPYTWHDMTSTVLVPRRKCSAQTSLPTLRLRSATDKTSISRWTRTSEVGLTPWRKTLSFLKRFHGFLKYRTH